MKGGGVKGDKKKKSDERQERKRHGRWQSENEMLKKDCIKEICLVRSKRGQERSQRGVETKRERQTETEGQREKSRDRIRE